MAFALAFHWDLSFTRLAVPFISTFSSFSVLIVCMWEGVEEDETHSSDLTFVLPTLSMGKPFESSDSTLLLSFVSVNVALSDVLPDLVCCFCCVQAAD